MLPNLGAILLLASTASAHLLGPLALRQHSLLRERALQSSEPSDVDAEVAAAYPAYTLSTPVDHFHNESRYEPHSSGSFNLRYWFDDTYYKPGGPIILIEGGETSGAGRIPFIQTGIGHILAKATNGMGVVIEHRYYGASFPVPDLTTKNMRFLTTDQALADTAYFAQNVVFKGHEHEDLTSKSVPWIAYGGSYAGAFVAFLRTQYPGVFWGSISSSGVTEAIDDYYQYFAPIAQYAPQGCVSMIEKLTNIVDKIIVNQPESAYATQIKQVFGLEDLQYTSDFAAALQYPLGGWQGLNWDPALSDPSFYQYCGNITSKKVQYPISTSTTNTIKSIVKAAGYPDKYVVPFQNFVGYINETVTQPCAGQINACYNTHASDYYSDRNTSNYNLISWPYQYCTQWGFFQNSHPLPPNNLPLISQFVNEDYNSLVCRAAFNITSHPDTQAITSRGGYRIAYERLAIIDGESDPWRPATPHSPDAKPWNRPNTLDQPFYLIPSPAVHHWDENGVSDNETTASFPPDYIKKIHAYEVKFVQKWVADAKECYGKGSKTESTSSAKLQKLFSA